MVFSTPYFLGETYIGVIIKKKRKKYEDKQIVDAFLMQIYG